jgi:hypothetical protein
VEELINAIENPTYSSFKRTFLLEDGKVVYKIILPKAITNNHK